MGAEDKSQSPQAVIADMLNECQHSTGVHARRAKELLAWRSQNNDGIFLTHLWKSLLPLLTIFKREPAAERLVKFVVTLATIRDEEYGAECDAFLEGFLGLLLYSADSGNKAVRLRSCQIISEIILRLKEDAEVSDNVWDNVIESMQKRMQDKIPAVRVYSVRALGRFASADDPENDAILCTFRKSLQLDQNPEVRRNIILLMPPSNSTLHDIVSHTSDVNEVVRKTAFTVLSKKFPIQSLSIKQRTCILKRGLHDRRGSVQAECLRMLKDVWLSKCCEGDVMTLLKYLDVETNESVGESVMLALLKADAIVVQNDQGLQKFAIDADADEGLETSHLLEAEEALYWRVLISYLYSEAQTKGHEAATTGGAHAVMNAAAATEKNELLDRLLPSTMTKYVQLVKIHLRAGPHLHFVARQLLLIGKHLDFSDAANRKVAGTFLYELLCMPTGQLEEETEVIIGDGLSLGGDKQWSIAIAELTWKVQEAQHEFAIMVSDVVAELSRPCREGGASVMQWINSLAVAGFLLENIKSLQQLTGCAVEAQELLAGLLLPAAKHIHPEVQRSALRCLGLFCTKEVKPSLPAIKQLRLAFLSGISSSQRMASKALFDLCMWHGATVLDRGICLCLTDDGDPKGDCGIPILELLAQKLDIHDTEQEQLSESVSESEIGDGETLQGILAEGFGKLLLQSKVYSDIIPFQQAVFIKLLQLYFNDQTRRAPRLRQCLSVFFETYPSVSLDHKSCIAKSFVPLMRAEWPGICGNEGGSQTTAAAKRKHVTKLSKFMLQILHQPLFESNLPASETCDSTDNLEQEKQPPKPVLDVDEELAVRIAAEVYGISSQCKSAAARSYLSMLCKNLCSLEFRQSEQELIRCLQKLLDNAKETLTLDKQTMKDLDNLQARLLNLDGKPEDAYSDEQLEKMLCNLEVEEPKPHETQDPGLKTPAPPPTRGRTRRTKKPSSSEDSSTSPVARTLAKTPAPPTTARAQRASKTAAMGKIRSDLAPSKKLIYASSDEDLTSTSSSDGGNESDSEPSEIEVERNLSAA